MNRIKWMIQDFLCGYTLERMELNSTVWGSIKYGFKLMVRKCEK